MSVYPDDSTPVPKGAYTPSSVKALQSVTESSARAEIRSQALVPWQEGRENFFDNIIGGIGRAFQDGLAGIASGLSDLFAPIFGAGTVVRDGQDKLTERTDLLSPLLDYCSMSTPPGSGDALKGSGRVPFSYQIGPRRGATPVDGMVRLEDQGLWDLRAMVTSSWVTVGSEIRAYLRVLEPDGETIFSEQGYHSNTLRSQTLTLVSSVVVPEPGYYVDVWVTASLGRGWWTGPQWTRLSAQHMSRSVEGGTGGEESSEGDDLPPEPPGQSGDVSPQETNEGE